MPNVSTSTRPCGILTLPAGIHPYPRFQDAVEYHEIATQTTPAELAAARSQARAAYDALDTPMQQEQE